MTGMNSFAAASISYFYFTEPGFYPAILSCADVIMV